MDRNDNYTWRALYDDGTELNQFERAGEANKGEERKYSDIVRGKLKSFVILRHNIPYVVYHLDNNKRLICRRRVSKSFGGKPEDVVWLVGYQTIINGKNVQNLSFIFQDGHIEIMDKFDENHKLFYPVVFREEEKS
jgi:hypothetical protein